MLVAAFAFLTLGAEPIAEQALDHTRAAHLARLEAARLEDADRAEAERHAGLMATARAEADRARAAARRDADALTVLREARQATSVTTATETLLAEAATRQAAALATIATLPGIIPRPTDPSFEAVTVAILAAERSAGQISVQVATGQTTAGPRAARVLRVSGAAAWWLALDGHSGGPVQLTPDGLRFLPGDPRPVAAAIAQSEGRAAPAVVLLPEPAP